jgi:hypothetical protein
MKNSVLYFLQEKEMEFYDNPKVVQKVADNSDPIHGVEDHMYSNSDIQSFYSRGNGFITDNHSDYYEAIKAVKDLTDKHLFLRDMTWKVDISNGNKIVFTFIVTKIDSDETTDFFLDGVQQHLTLNLIRKLGEIYDFDSKILSDEENHKILKLTLTRNDNIKNRIELVQVSNSNIELMNPKGASVSRI